jgi:sucrose-phosphate synthase
MRNLLVCDLDGTLLGEPVSLKILLKLLREPNAPVLAFASGRQGFSATALLSEWGVDSGAYLIAGVGTELYRRIGKTWISVAGWPELTHPWEAQRVRRELQTLDSIAPQSVPVNSPYKLSYYAAPAAVDHVRERLRLGGIEATLVHSHEQMLDVLPPGIDKGSAVRWLARRLRTPFEKIMTCGNTANDIAMLGLPCASVIVGEADNDLLAAAPSLPETYVASAPCAAGIIEGLQHYGWLSGSAWAV